MAKVTVYSTPTCPYCHYAKHFLQEHNIEFADIDVSADPAKAEEAIHKSGQMGVPVIIVEQNGKEDVVIGFDEERLSELLGVK